MSATWGPPDEEGWEKNSVEFAFYHCLVDDDPDHAAPALLALGRIAASWSRLEHHIDALLIQVNQPHHSVKLFQEHPVSFGKKVELLKRWFNQYPPLAAYTDDMRWFTVKLKELSKENRTGYLTRNVLLHSIPAAFDAEKGVVTLHHMQWEQDMIRSRHIDVTMTQLSGFADAIQLANQFLGYITQELFTPAGLERLRKRE